jgi:hypothetical protein
VATSSTRSPGRRDPSASASSAKLENVVEISAAYPGATMFQVRGSNME